MVESDRGRLISVGQAQRIVVEETRALRRRKFCELSTALGRVLGQDIESPLDLPSFDNSSVDGYAVKLPGDSWVVENEIKAGDFSRKPLSMGKAARIFTGAAIPRGTDAIIMQEHVLREGNKIM